jgi:hypothetical protein
MGRFVAPWVLVILSCGCNQVFGIEVLGPCRDADGDGHTTCTPDCDDANAALHQGQPEICGDGRDNDCDGTPDQYCQGLGTFVAGAVGNDSNPGTQELPVATVNKAMAHARAIGHGVDVYIANGFYLEDVALVEGVSMFGGYQCEPNICDWETRIRPPNDIMSCLSTIDVDGVVADDSITRDTVLDHMCIDGSGANIDAGPRVTAFTIDGGSPTLRNSFVGGSWWFEATPCEGGYAVEILRAGDPPPIFDNSTVFGSECGEPGALTAAMQLSGPQAAVEVVQSEIRGGVGRTGLGMRLQDGSRATILESSLIGGLCFEELFETEPSTEQSFALLAEARTQVHVDRSYFNTLFTLCDCTDEVDPMNEPWCSGVRVQEPARFVMTNSVVYGLVAPRTAAVMVSSAGESEVVINSNVLIGGSAIEDPMAPTPENVALLVVEAAGGAHPVGRFRNNVMRGSTASVTRFGIFEQGAMATQPQVEALTHNNIVNVDVAYRTWNGTTAALIASVAEMTSLPFAEANFGDDCMLDLQFHLPAGSPCIDRGIADEAPDHDFDGEPRPRGAGVDVGVDETR